MNTNTKLSLVVVVCLVVGLGAGYWYGSSKTYQAGYDKAISDTKAAQGELAQKASADAAKAANPFQVQNPLEGVKANPFEEAAKKLNPFAQ